ncbi:AMIN domain-containing protein [Plectonema cf. radiosum LEGE 06105]|uniref:AMIN domain-containing protein n=1 Tax=Plectonema cf. radiosum LEGE 06105 TaxID=945769 RepID=A0A8J7JX95_9CYAN|nr:type IV pilus secretin family protein [Plectonema radiosum]MBE9216460.1 AMIN domain-containing protein [Plectonema cf. radiosum LEGE 06105]
MKKIHGNNFIFGTAVSLLLVSQPVWAQSATKITGVKLDPVDGGVNLVLKTSDGSRPQVFTTKRGNTLVADIINTQLLIPQGNNFRQDNPTDGIASVSMSQLDANSVRVIITGTSNAPETKPVMRNQNGLTFALIPGTSTASDESQSIEFQPPQNDQIAQSTPAPNPQVNLEATPAPPAGPGQSMNQAPPFLPRAVAPPVGDIAVSNTDASPSVIDLGTEQRVPRLVLRDAPVREVLSLLARAANLNLAYTGGSAKAEGGEGAAAAGADGPTISLDIENEPVQDVFNYVLRLSGLEANRSGRTIFVGTNLPNSTRDTVMRNMRLNQVSVGVALNFLVGLGAESAISRERLVTSVNAVPVGGGAQSAITQTQTTTEVQIETQRVDYQDSNPLLRGLQALGDERTNSVTLIGDPKTIQIAMAQLTQLDVRRRQVAVNVKIIDVNLLGTKNFNSSFSFGVADNFFSVDGGRANANVGGVKPPTSSEFESSRLTPTITTAPFPEGAEVSPFLDAPNNDAPFGDVDTARPPFGSNSNPFKAGITQITPGTPGTSTTEVVPTAIDPVTGEPTRFGFQTTTTPSTPTQITYGLPTLFQYPKRFLASLQTQVTNGNAKVLTDPTLMVQEGQEAVVNLTAEVYGGIEVRREDGDVLRKPIIKNAGLTLAVKVDRIDDNGFVSLSVAPTVSAPGGTATTGGEDGEITLLSERSLRSGQIRMRDGQTLILSGIIQESDRVSVSKVPILGDIPLLGSLFRSTNKNNQRNEVIVLLTPQVMDDSQNSSYGYNYKPSPEVRRMLQNGGLKLPRN